MRRLITSSHPFAMSSRVLLGLGLLFLLGTATTLAVLGVLEAITVEEFATSRERIPQILGTAAWASGSLAVILILISLGLAMRTRRNVQRITEGAEKLASGDLSHRLQPTEDPQLDLIVDGLNSMARELERMLRGTQLQRFEQGAILDAIDKAMIAVDCDLNLLRSNLAAEKLFGLTDADKGRSIRDALGEASVHDLIQKVLNEGCGSSSEFDSEVIDDRQLQAVAERMFDATGGVLGVVVVIEDVTELRLLEQIRSDFAANVSHELRTPITNIKGYAETLELGDEVDEEQTQHCLKVIRRNADRLGRIIEDLLTLARLERVAFTEEGEHVELSVQHVLNEAIDRIMFDARARSVEFEVACDQGIWVHTRGNLLVQAIANLLENAVRYGPDGQKVTITAARTGDTITFAIEDQGPGIPQEHLPRLFERFYRVDKARSRAEGGTGLGLAIVKHIALVHGGSVEAESRVDRGSIFTIEIPAPKISGRDTSPEQDPGGSRVNEIFTSPLQSP